MGLKNRLYHPLQQPAHGKAYRRSDSSQRSGFDHVVHAELVVRNLDDFYHALMQFGEAALIFSIHPRPVVER